MNKVTVKKPQDFTLSFDPELLSKLESVTIEFVKTFSKIMVPAISEFIENIDFYVGGCVNDDYRHINPRCFYLSKYAKKSRVRKKNAHRLIRMAREGVKK